MAFFASAHGTSKAVSVRAHRTRQDIVISVKGSDPHADGYTVRLSLTEASGLQTDITNAILGTYVAVYPPARKVRGG